MADKQNSGIAVLVETRRRRKICAWVVGSIEFVGSSASADAVDSPVQWLSSLSDIHLGQLIGKTAHRIFVIFNPHAGSSSMARRLRQPKRCHQRPLRSRLGCFASTGDPHVLKGQERLRFLENHRHVVTNQLAPFGAERRSKSISSKRIRSAVTRSYLYSPHKSLSQSNSCRNRITNKTADFTFG